MTTTWTLQTSGQADIALTGDTLAQAVEQNLHPVMRAIGMTNAAGYRLTAVRLIPAGRTSITYSGVTEVGRHRTRLEISGRPYHLDELRDPMNWCGSQVETRTGLIFGPEIADPVDLVAADLRRQGLWPEVPRRQDWGARAPEPEPGVTVHPHHPEHRGGASERQAADPIRGGVGPARRAFGEGRDV